MDTIYVHGHLEIQSGYLYGRYIQVIQRIFQMNLVNGVHLTCKMIPVEEVLWWLLNILVLPHLLNIDATIMAVGLENGIVF